MRGCMKKRLTDIGFSLALLVLTAPVFLAIVVLQCLAYRGKVFFLQARAGKHGKIFTLIKFRTMTEELDTDGQLLPDHLRVPRLGAWLRASSLDELPQLLNVLKGEMSLVGPRPLLPEYLPLYSPEQRRRHEVLPGITGWAQVNGRNTVDWGKKFEYDLWYVDNHSLRLDLAILLKTVKPVVSRQQIYPEGRTSVEKFRGMPS
ncbi:Sugar transferase involved in LPS biosynthesis (colanic, teichoic acid) [Cyclobacterium xiamenense]|uniref:Sugar transferase involved in LPS biosynthesis (Colanic, teichoic acid) n=2 Tax=Cyclobacterium xiamenense TaxID=1297121 RepID=A0A1H6ZC42_9BACT|nr:Sugar transferase involved in LPS biosynthesis (colanic, teichoic acid) [Cyclobacterium xiamenense]